MLRRALRPGTTARGLMGCGSSISSATRSSVTRGYSYSPPVASLVPPGECAFTEEFKAVPLLSKSVITHDTRVFTFAVPGDPDRSLGLSTCACILAKGGCDAEGNPLVRPYTPISTNDLKGKFELLVKCYSSGLAKHMDQLQVGETVEFKHIPFNVKTQYPFKKGHIGMIAGGTGITPMIQALHAILGTTSDETQVTLLYGNRTVEDILLKDTLDKWVEISKGRLKVVHVLSAENSAGWNGKTGFITQDLIAEHVPPPSVDVEL